MILLCRVSPQFNTQLVDYKSRINESDGTRVETNGEFARFPETSKCIFYSILHYTHETAKLILGITLRQFSALQQFDRRVKKVSSGLRTEEGAQYSRHPRTEIAIAKRRPLDWRVLIDVRHASTRFQSRIPGNNGTYRGRVIFSGRMMRSNSFGETKPRRIASSRSVVPLTWAALATCAALS
jgi:hypothetical protein